MLLWLVHPLWAQAQTGLVDAAEPAKSTLREVTVSTPRGNVPPLAVSGSVDRVDAEQLRDSNLQVNLSESLGAVPGLQVQNRQNYAQDLQLSIRGFGARSTFGVRGVRLYVDGIPATLPDGQGQTSNIDIGSADRIEVLRGPFSALYGNSSGGVVQVFTESGEGAPKLSTSVAGGSFGTWRESAKASGASGAIDWLLSTSSFQTDGWREHSAARRDIANGKLGVQLDDDSRLTLIANSVRLSAQDPLGLTQAQAALNPRSAALATQYDTRKTVEQTQLGLLYERRLGADDDLRLMVYGGERRTTQFQAIPVSAQLNPLQSGGVIDLRRDYAGFDARWTARRQLADRPLEVVAGFAYDALQEQRRGYENFVGRAAAPLLGVQGRLRRDERNDVSNLDPYVQTSWRVADRWTLDAGVRYSTVRFTSKDHYIVGPNGDDSGAARYRQALPVAALRYAATTDLSLYVTAGRGFETPTLNELSYRPGGLAGLNFALRPSVNDSVEVGAKARVADGLLTAALFHTRTADEIVTNANVGGRATFQNAGRTRRDGFELGWMNETVGHWRTQLAWTWLDARYRDAFCSPSPCVAGNAVAAGNLIPGIAKQSVFASFGYAPPEGWRAGAELRVLGRIQANDANTASAAGYAVAALHTGYVRRWQRWEFNAFARIDNLFDRRVIGSVIVNEGNARYFEPAPGRTWTAGLGAAYRF
ncbi:MAG: TonB-dependent receptor [Variovorax sp.]